MKRFTAAGAVLSAVFVLGLAQAEAAEDKGAGKWPLGLDRDVYLVPEDNPVTPAKTELGRLLYFDKRLSADGTISCASCHNPQKGFIDNLPFSPGIKGQKGTRSSPTVINAAFSLFQFWDGRASSLEEQAKGPIANPVEMGHTLEGAVESIKNVPGYGRYFKDAFGDETVTIDRIAQAIATFERTILSGNSAWDRYIYGGDKTALSESARRGLELFQGKALCTRCHVGFNLTDGVFHNLGVGMKSATPDLGRFNVTGQEKDKGAFKTPTLRDIQKTAPYMHDGSEKTLEDVVEFYDKGGEPNPWLDKKMEPLRLTPQEKEDLIAFLKSLEGDWVPQEEPELPK